MKDLEFEWDAAKAKANEKKHGITFDEASSIWNDLNRIESPDVKHSEFEDRTYTIGVSERFRLLAVVYTERYETIRIISARRANQTETRRYTAQD